MKKYIFYIKRYAGLCALGLTAVIGSFSLGIHSTANVQPGSLIEAGSIHMRGDMNENGILDTEDVRILLEVAVGYREATPKLLQLDPNNDGILSVDDVLRILSLLE